MMFFAVLLILSASFTGTSPYPLIYHVVSDLISSLLQWKWVVIISDKHKDIDPILVEMLNERSVQVVSWTYRLKRTLRDLIRQHGTVNVVLQQSNEVILNEFKGSCRINWLVMADSSSFNLSVFDAGAFDRLQILIVQSLPNKRGFAIQVPKPSGLVLENVNSWSLEKGFTNDSAFLPCPKSEIKPLRIVMEKHFPFFQPQNGSRRSIGSDIKLLDSLSKALNFAYEIQRPPDGSWGSRNGTKWNGMIRMLIHNEVDAAMSGMTITYDRYMAVRFSIPYAFDRYTYVTKKPSRKLKTWAIFWPYTLQVWSSIALSVLIVSVLMTFLQNALVKQNKHRVHFADTALFIFQALLNQGNYNASETRCRILMSFWWGFCITVVAGYNGSLMSFMAHPGFNQALDTVPQLVDAIKSKSFAAGTIKNSADYNVFKNSEEEDLQVILNSMKSDPRNLVAHDIDGLRECLRRDYAYIGGELTVQADVWDNRLFLFATDSFLQYGYAIAFTPGFDHIDVFDKKILQLRESGIVKKWMEEIMERQQFMELQKKGESQNEEDGDAIHVLRVDDVQGAFSVLSIGLLISTLSCIAEYHTYTYQFHKRNCRKC